MSEVTFIFIAIEQGNSNPFGRVAAALTYTGPGLLPENWHPFSKSLGF
jgi:hypothetical protein